MIAAVRPYYLANRPVTADDTLTVTDKYNGSVVAKVTVPDGDAVEAAIVAAVAACEPMRKMPPWARQAVLEHCVRRLTERQDELTELLCAEVGKPVRDARGEVLRLIETFRIAAEESVRIDGEVLTLARSQRTTGYRGFTQRVPVGACVFITPFNFPLNLVAHKVAPAIAAGCPFIVKPSERTPLSALVLGDILAETNLPVGAFSVLPCRLPAVRALVTDARIKLLSFTGSDTVGWALKAEAGRKKVVLELGGNAACIVDGDSADTLDAIADRLTVGTFYQSGQSCISVQRIIVHESVYAPLRDKLIARTQALRVGDPHDPQTHLGPMIDEAAAVRLHGWIAQAMDHGARLLCGGKRHGAMLDATLLEAVGRDEPVRTREAFGPVAVLSTFTDFGEALREANDTDYGLQLGVFTQRIEHALRAWDEADVGGVIVGDVPSFRADAMPYGGVRGSGLGREGVRWAIEELTEPRLLVLRSESTDG